VLQPVEELAAAAILKDEADGEIVLKKTEEISNTWV
jgi:hypothetical protein